MSNRLLSLLTSIERSVIASEPAPGGGAWDTLRLINFHQGLARLTLSVRSADRVTSGRGGILLQHFTLADGTSCLKANLTWNGSEKNSVYSIYAKPLLNWESEAAQIASKWLDGLSSLAAAGTVEQHHEANPFMAAAG